MKYVKPVLSVTAVAVTAFFTWNYLAGPLKYRRDMQSFADNLENCEAGTTSIKSLVGGMVLDHTVDGPRGDRCDIRIDSLGPHVVHCSFPTKQLPGIAKAFSDSAKSVGIFGSVSYRVSTSNPDPLTEAMNSDACEAIAP